MIMNLELLDFGPRCLSGENFFLRSSISHAVDATSMGQIHIYFFLSGERKIGIKSSCQALREAALGYVRVKCNVFKFKEKEKMV